MAYGNLQFKCANPKRKQPKSHLNLPTNFQSNANPPLYMYHLKHIRWRNSGIRKFALFHGIPALSGTVSRIQHKTSQKSLELTTVFTSALLQHHCISTGQMIMEKEMVL
jgi:hypothetical protein